MAAHRVADDDAHQVHDLGEEQSLRVYWCRRDVLEQGVDGPGVQGVFQGGPGHDGDGALLCEPLEDVVEDHGAASVENGYLPVWRHFSRRITPTSKPCLLGIVNDVLDFSKIEAGKLELVPDDFSLREVSRPHAALAVRGHRKGW